MATANQLEDELSCSVCFDIYQDPHILRECFHTFCHKCIKQLEKRGRVQCPECREYTNINEVKKDFKTQRFIDIHHKQKLESKYYETMADLKTNVENIDKELNNISSNITDVQQSNTRQLSEVKTFTEDRLQALKDQEKTLEKLINDVNDNLINTLQMRRETLSQQKKEMQTKVQFVEDLIQSKDMVTLKVMVNNVNENVQKNIVLTNSILSQNTGYIRSKVTVQKGENWGVEGSIEVKVNDVEGSIKVKVNDMMYNSQQIQPVLKSSELYTRQYQCNKRVKLDYSPYKLCVINNQLWCVGTDGGLRVYDKDCKLVKQVKHDKISDAVSLTVSDTGHIIVACSDNNGLHQMDCNGQYLTLIKQGSFSDVVCYHGDIYAMEYEQCKIIVLTKVYNIDKWTEVTRYDLQHSDGDSWDRLYVDSVRIYISVHNDHCVYIYNIHGQFIQQIGERGNNRPGELDGPVFCDVITTGTMLIADCWNNRLQVYDNRGDWYVMTLPGEVECPIHAVVGDDGELWIIQNVPKILIKYTVN